MRKTSLRHCAVVLAVAALAATAQAQTIDFTTTRVPTGFFGPGLETRGGTRVLGLNDQGQYVGMFGERNSTILGVPHAFIFGSTGFGTTPPPPGTPPGWPGGFRLGVIEGELYTNPNYRYLDLAPAGFPSDFNLGVSTPNAINNAGVVVGRLGTGFLDNGPYQAFRYDSISGELSILAVPGAVTSEAVDVNASGQIVGNFTDAEGQRRGFVLTGSTYSFFDMPDAFGNTSLAGINDLGHVIGRAANNAADPRSFVFRNGGFEFFTANGLFTIAADINNSGQIVGWVGITGQRRGFFLDSEQTVILDLSTNGSSTYAYTINNAGLIGGAIEGGGGVGFLATVSPVPEPATWLLGLFGLGCLGRSMQVKRRQATPQA